ncbi:NDR1/HIN1-like protein 1 [Lycium barbarum]|uniref:NDR1/HIN1-like protein 1 n=1 Tax=Lycium barbarum TaxID=112863 RepID=UPI00293F2E55|nr:NDR1/HIN1-like protein 1 [Lycium barbarum]
MTEKDCGHHHDEEPNNPLRRLIAALIGFVILILFIILLIWLILRPTKPHFILQDATVYAFNTSAPFNFLTTNVQITIASRNPNGRIGIYYDKLDVYATYRGQQVTLPTLLPQTYQGHKDVSIWSPFVYGNNVPIAPYLGSAISQDLMVGTVLLNVKIDGRVKWKVGSFISGKYHLYVNCPAYVGVGGKMMGNSVVVGKSSAIKYQLVQNCHVDV